MDRDPVRPGQARGEVVGRPSRQRLGLHTCTLRTPRVDREVPAQGQLLEAHELGALTGRQPHALLEGTFVLERVLVPALLHGPHPQRPSLGRASARRRGLRSEGGEDPDRVHFEKAGRFPAYTVESR